MTQYIIKAEGKAKKNVALINSASDIPAHLEGIVTVVDGKIVFHASGGDQAAEAKDGPYAFLAYADGSYALLKLASNSAKEYSVTKLGMDL